MVDTGHYGVPSADYEIVRVVSGDAVGCAHHCAVEGVRGRRVSVSAEKEDFDSKTEAPGVKRLVSSGRHCDLFGLHSVLQNIVDV